VSSAPKKSPPVKAASPASSVSGALPLSRYIAYFAIATVGCALDLFTKEAVFRWRGLPQQNNVWWLIEGRLGIETSVNPGALFGMGAGWWWIFACLSVVALAGIFTWLFVFKAARDRWLTVALAFVTGGILGNLYDRLALGGQLPPALAHGVRDWILFRWPESGLKIFNPWPNFNIADSLLVTGAIMLVVHALVWRDAGQEAVDGTALTRTAA
jgi:signal peptidase II